MPLDTIHNIYFKCNSCSSINRLLRFKFIETRKIQLNLLKQGNIRLTQIGKHVKTILLGRQTL